mgnify:CR=1 FL=1
MPLSMTKSFDRQQEEIKNKPKPMKLKLSGEALLRHKKLLYEKKMEIYQRRMARYKRRYGEIYKKVMNEIKNK